MNFPKDLKKYNCTNLPVNRCWTLLSMTNVALEHSVSSLESWKHTDLYYNYP